MCEGAHVLCGLSLLLGVAGCAMVLFGSVQHCCTQQRSFIGQVLCLMCAWFMAGVLSNGQLCVKRLRLCWRTRCALGWLGLAGWGKWLHAAGA